MKAQVKKNQELQPTIDIFTDTALPEVKLIKNGGKSGAMGSSQSTVNLLGKQSQLMSKTLFNVSNKNHLKSSSSALFKPGLKGSEASGGGFDTNTITAVSVSITDVDKNESDNLPEIK